MLRKQGMDPSGWAVCPIRVKEVTDLGWNAIFVESSDFPHPAHCEIRGTLESPLSNDKKWTRLARQTRLLTTDEEIDSLRMGDTAEKSPLP